MRFKEVALSNASAEAKIAGLAVLLDKELLRLSEVVLNTKKLQGPQGEQGFKGEKGDRGFDGTNGKDGSDGKDGKDGHEGKDGVGVQDAKIDFDGSLVITLTNGREINAGDVVPEGVADKIKVIKSGGGNSQTVLDAIEDIQATIATYGTMATQNANAVAITGGSINGATIGATTASTGVFTTLTATGQTSLGGDSSNPSLLVSAVSGVARYIKATGSASSNVFLEAVSTGGNPGFVFTSRGTGSHAFTTNSNTGTVQFQVSHTASAVNYVQVTGSATGGQPLISPQGSDTNVSLSLTSKGVGNVNFWTNNSGSRQFAVVNTTGTIVNYTTATGSATGAAPAFSVAGSDTNIDLTLTPKGTGNVRFGTLTASADAAITGYITIKDSGGTVRKLAVIA